MKKKIVCVLALLFLFVSYASAYGYGIPDPSAEAEYRGTTATVRAYDLWLEQKQRATVTLYKVEKLTKAENNLLWSALNEYDYKAGEVYSVFIAWLNEYANKVTRSLSIYVEIQKDGSANWYGWRANY